MLLTKGNLYVEYANTKVSVIAYAFSDKEYISYYLKLNDIFYHPIKKFNLRNVYYYNNNITIVKETVPPRIINYFLLISEKYK